MNSFYAISLLEDRIFEELPINKAQVWPIQFSIAIAKCTSHQLDKVINKFIRLAPYYIYWALNMNINIWYSISSLLLTLLKGISCSSQKN